MNVSKLSKVNIGWSMVGVPQRRDIQDEQFRIAETNNKKSTAFPPVMRKYSAIPAQNHLRGHREQGSIIDISV